MSVKEIKLTRGVPPPESFPNAQLQECAQAVLSRDTSVVLQYGAAGGYQPLRALLAAQVGVEEKQVIIGQGSLQLQDFIVRSLLGTGSRVYVEEPTYDRAITVMRRSGAQVVGLRSDADGLDPDDLAQQLRKGEKPVLVYLIPDFQNPSGTVLSLEKRQQIAALAREYDFWIVEDIPYRRLRYRGQDVPTCLELAPERVMQMSSFSKLISPGLRVGYVSVPQELAGKLLKTIEDTYISPSFLVQAMVLEYIQRGWLESNIARLKALYTPRLSAMLQSLEREMSGLARWQAPEGGFFVSAYLNTVSSADDLTQRAKQAGLALTDGRGFYANGGGDNFVRLPFCALTPEEICTGIARLAEVVRGMETG